MWVIFHLGAALLAAMTALAPGHATDAAEAPAKAPPSAGVTLTVAPHVPTTVAALGDSITRGYDACGFYVDCGSHSWATGTDDRIDSQTERLAKAVPHAATEVHNDAADGARAADLPAQARTAVAQHADYVTVLVGANDVCRQDVADMTPVATFRTQVDTALDTLQRGGARVLVASIPDLGRLWQVGHENLAARVVWKVGHVCPALLSRPTSTSGADTARRAAVTTRVDQLDTALAEVCAAHRGCRWDGGAVHRYPFTLHELSKFDFFHPNVNGQHALATVTWRAGFRW